MDRSLVCRECGVSFVFTQGEQEFFQQKGLVHAPQRCPDCRKRAKDERRAARASQMHDVTCSNCGKPAQVPFNPTNGKPVYCRDCYRDRRPATGR